jgi:hypothetical protein
MMSISKVSGQAGCGQQLSGDRAWSYHLISMYPAALLSALVGVNFYKACNLGGSERIDNADQRVTADISQFSDEIAGLYASLLKPLLDVVLFTYKLKTILGWQGPAAMHSYFVFSAIVKKKVSRRQSAAVGGSRRQSAWRGGDEAQQEGGLNSHAYA